MAATRISAAMLADKFPYGFNTLAEAQAASPGANVTAFHTLGRNSAFDGGMAVWVYNPSASHTAVITCANGRKYELRAPIANVRIFGATGQNDGDDSEGFRQAISYAILFKVPAYAPAGIYQIHSSCTVNASDFVFYGDGSLTRLRGVDLETEIFKLDCGAGVLTFLQFHDFAPEAFFSGGGIPATGAVFRVVGSAAGCGVGQSQFYNIQPRGWPVFFANQAPTRVTTFGNEGAVNWCRWDNIDFNPFTRQSLFGFYFSTGSGTGNKFTRCGGVMNNSAWFYDGGTNIVVGDICIEEMEHWSSANTSDSTILTINTNTVYRSRITIKGGQLDAGFKRVLNLATGGVGYSNVIVDTQLGGDAVMGAYPSLATSNLGPTLGTVSAS